MKNILFSASDPGGGNSIVPVVRKLSSMEDFKVFSILSGASKNIWEKQGLEYIDGDSLSEENLIIKLKEINCDVFVFGTSVADTIDKKIFLSIKEMGVKTLAVIDYWSNYWQRFSSQNKDFCFLPDIVCTLDELAKDEMIAEGFPENIIRTTGNPHFDHFADDITLDSESPKQIIFISQPVSLSNNDSRYNDVGFDEITVVSDLKQILEEVQSDYQLIIRPHPRDDPSKFQQFINNKIRLSTESSLEQDLSNSKIVIGIDSQVLLQAIIAGKIVISYQPGIRNKHSSVISRVSKVDCFINKNDLKLAVENKFKTLSTASVYFPKDSTDKVIKEIQSI